MNKKELIAHVAEMNDMTKSEVERVLNASLEGIQDAMAEGEEIDLYGFGKFSVVERAARTGRNPKTGEPLEIAASNSVKFKAAKAFRDAIK